jgi:hypothetical protein
MKYFSQSVPSFYQFFYLPLSGIFSIIYFLYLPFPAIILPSIAAIFAGLSMQTKQIHYAWICACIMLLTGRLWYETYTHQQFERTYNKTKINCSGVITDIKQNVAQSVLTLQTQSINGAPAQYTILLHWPHYLATPHLHDELELQDITLQCANGSYQLYLQKERVYATAHLTKKAIVSLQQAHTLALPVTQSHTVHTLMQTIILGAKLNNPLYTHIKNVCNWWGIRHYLARSGLHFSILFFLILYLLTFLPMPWHIKQTIISIVCVAVYTSTWYSVSFLRAFLFYLLITMCNVFHLRIVPIHLLNIVFCSIVLYNPFSLCFLDFQLTFSATYLLLWLNTMGLFARYS